MIKKNKFLEQNNVADMTELLGEKLDMEAEFDNLDNENKEKVENLSPPLLFEFLILGSLCIHYTVGQRKGPPEQFTSFQVMFSEIISWAFKKTMKRNIAAKK